MTNEEIAVLIKNGNQSFFSLLWERTQSYIFMLAQRWYYYDENYYLSYGIDLGDLKQYGYFALLKAIEKYNPEKAHPLIAYLKYAYKREIQKHLRKSEGLNRYTPLDAPAADEGDEPLANFIEDDKNEPVNERVESYITAGIVRKAVENLPENQQNIIFGIYFENMEIETVAFQENVSAINAMKIRNAAFSQLRKDSGIRGLRDIYCSGIYRDGYRAFQRSGITNAERVAISRADAI